MGLSANLLPYQTARLGNAFQMAEDNNMFFKKLVEATKYNLDYIYDSKLWMLEEEAWVNWWSSYDSLSPSRQLKAKWTRETAQDLLNTHGISSDPT
jgi:hypothetical protein